MKLEAWKNEKSRWRKKSTVFQDFFIIYKSTCTKVIKKNGRRSPFEREKLAKSIFTALKKRPIDSDTIERVVSKISRELEEIGQSEILSSIVGKKVMDALKELDKIGYIRFASVYTNFKEVGEFEEYIEELDGKSKKS